MKEILPISVVIPCYNSQDTILLCLQSVFEQTAPPAEIICVDDCSNDSTRQILEELQKSHPNLQCQFFKNNQGPAKARNAAWELSSQPYIAFLDSDDVWHPEKLEIQYQDMITNPNITLSAHNCIWKKEGWDSVEPEARNLSLNRLLVSNCFKTPSVMLKKEFVNDRFPEDMMLAEDYLLWLTIMLKGGKARFLEAPLAKLLKAPYGEGGLSQDLPAMDKALTEMFKRLNNQKLISLPLYVLMRVYSKLKHYRRIMKSKFNKV